MTTVLKSGSLNLLEPSGPVQACNRIALPLNALKDWFMVELDTFHKLCSLHRSQLCVGVKEEWLTDLQKGRNWLNRACGLARYWMFCVDKWIKSSVVMLSASWVVVSLTRWSWARFLPATETLRADSRAVTCYPEDGGLTFGGWVVVVKEWKLTGISIY